jgi:hypothetical protein
VDFARERVQAASGADQLRAEPTSVFPFDVDVWNSLWTLLGNDWFERLWVWQEVQAQPEHTMLSIGTHKMPWNSFRGAVLCLALNVATQMDPNRNALYQAFLVCQKSTAFPNLKQLLDATRRSKCADPRDKIYAMLGITSRSMPYSIIPDYTKSMREVYTELIMKEYHYKGWLNLLAYGNGMSYLSNVPSWVPDWSMKPLRTRD